jgi:hypothetical protein
MPYQNLNLAMQTCDAMAADGPSGEGCLGVVFERRDDDDDDEREREGEGEEGLGLVEEGRRDDL